MIHGIRTGKLGVVWVGIIAFVIPFLSNGQSNYSANKVGLSVSYSSLTEVNLPSDDATDWVLWAADNGEKDIRNSGKNTIPNFTLIGPDPKETNRPGGIDFSWKNGKTVKKGTASASGVSTKGERNGFRLVVPASTKNQTLKLYVSSREATAMLYCKGYGFGFWTDTEKTWLTNKSGESVRCYTLNFTAPSDTCHLIVEYKMQFSHGENAGITLHAATLREHGLNRPPVVAITTPADFQKTPEKKTLIVQSKAHDPDGSIAKVQYYMGGATTMVGESSTPPYTIEIPNLSHRVYAISARAFDQTGQAVDSEPRWFEMTTEENFPPEVEPLEEHIVAGPMEGVGHMGIQSMAELANGDLICVFYAGNYENAEDQKLYTCWFRQSTGEWTKPVVSFDEQGLKCANAVLYVDEKGKVFCFYTVVYGPGFEMSRVRLRTSMDYGKTWGPFQEMAQPDYPYETGTIVAIKPIKLANGEIMLPLNRESYDPDPMKSWFSLFAFSADGGKTWMESAPIYSQPGNIQPAPQQMPDGSIVAYFRPRGLGHEIWRSVSTDNGRSWAPLEKGGILNPSTRSDFVFTEKGNFVLACNDSPTARSPFIVALSKDRGQTWPIRKILESGPSWYCYASLIQTRDGRLHVSYDDRRRRIKHMIIDEAWLEK